MKIFEKIKILLSSEIKHRIFQLNEIGLFPNFINFYTNLFTQNYRGSVTISPLPQSEDYWNLLQNPSEKEIMRCSQLGQKYCWESKIILKNIIIVFIKII